MFYWNNPLLLLAMNLRFYSFIFSRFQNFCLIAQILRTFFITYAILTPSNYRDSKKAFWEGFLMKSCQICIFAQLDKVFVVQFAYSYSSHLYRGRSRLFCKYNPNNHFKICILTQFQIVFLYELLVIWSSEYREMGHIFTTLKY